MTRVVVYVRSDVDWESLNEENFFSQERRAPGISDEYLQKFFVGIQLWNQLYDMSFFEYRRRLRDISAINFDRIVGLDAVVRSFETLQRMRWSKEPTWVLPIDDDDWYHPELANICRENDPNIHHFLYWPTIRLIPVQATDDDEPEYSPQKPFENYKFLLTNMYAVSNSGIQAVPGLERQGVLTHHGRSIQTVKKYHGDRWNTAEFHQPLALTYKSPASFTQVTWPKTLDQMEAFINSGARSFERHRMQLPAWATPYAKLAGDLLDELIESRKSS